MLFASKYLHLLYTGRPVLPEDADRSIPRQVTLQLPDVAGTHRADVVEVVAVVVSTCAQEEMSLS